MYTDRKYLTLAFLLGVLCKLYDDLADNNLYSALGIAAESREYVNAILKNMFILGFALVSVDYPFYLITFVVCNFCCYVRVANDFGPYEYSGFVAPIVLVPFLNWKGSSQFMTNSIWAIIAGIVTICGDTPKEYSWYKLLTRSLGLGVSMVLALFGPVTLVSPDMRALFISATGYLSLSCITQYLLLKKIIVPKIDSSIEQEDEVQSRDTDPRVEDVSNLNTKKKTRGGGVKSSSDHVSFNKTERPKLA